MSPQRLSYIWKIYRLKHAIDYADVGECLKFVFNDGQEQRSKSFSASSAMSSSAFEKKSGSSHLIHAIVSSHEGFDEKL